VGVSASLHLPSLLNLPLLVKKKEKKKKKERRVIMLVLQDDACRTGILPTEVLL